MAEGVDSWSQRRQVRMRRFEERGFHRLDVQFTRLQDIPRNPRVAEYLYTANFDVVEVSPTAPVRARIAQFPGLTIVHALVPRVSVVWKRDQQSLGAAMIMLVRRGDLEFSPREAAFSRGSGVHLVLPGGDPVGIRAVEPDTELMYLSIPARFLHETLRPFPPRAAGDRIMSAALEPIWSFLASLCSLSVGDLRNADPLETAAEEMVRSILRLISDAESPLDQTLFSAAMEVLSSDYPIRGLNADDVAERLSVSTRTLQAAFQEHSTTVSSSLRRIRAAAAANLRREQPTLSRSAIAEMCGFGSVDSLDRAARESLVEAAL